MDEPVDIWCGPELLPRSFSRRRTVLLNTVPDFHNVNLRIKNITKKLAKNLSPVVLDLLEIASYVYAADQSVRRGGRTLRGDGKDWRREFVYHIPVRRLDLWQSEETSEALVNLLTFLSDDFYEFKFRELTREVDPQTYIDFDEGRPWFDANKVMLFSGGLDSLAGLCESVKDDNQRIVLVSHRPAPQTDHLQRKLLADFTGLTESQKRLLHVPVWINKAEKLTKDTHQRTRSFLYASLAASLAHMHNLSKVYFYENGITSSNLAIAPSALGARTSRTTHPQVLKGFSRLLSVIFNQDFSVDNPFFWKTKADIVKIIRDCGAKDLIRHTSSCSHVRSGNPLGNHCGVCSQCIGRRLAILHNSAEADDPEEMYRVRMPLDPITKDIERAMLELIIKAARDFESADVVSFFGRYGQAMAIVTALDMKSDPAANRLLELHKRHGQQVCQVLQDIVETHGGLVARGGVPANSMLSMIAEQPTKTPAVPKGCMPISLPEDTVWEDITVEIVGNDAAKIFIGDQYHAVTAFDMGFKDHKKNLPNRIWDLLFDFAEAGGTLAWSSEERTGHWYHKDFQRLRNTLKAFFGLTEDPLAPYDKKVGYQTRFSILYDRTAKT
ncbi:MAG: 7-cyano-7-deazaguanine synthase [bacterium]